MNTFRHLCVMIVAVVAAFITLAFAAPIDEYVAKPDAVYGWNATGRNISTDSYVAHLFNVTSQSWLTEQDTNRHVWTHTVIFIIPKTMDQNCTDAFIWFTWGDNNKVWSPDPQNDIDLAVVGDVAKYTNCPAIAVYDIPNQPIDFYKDKAASGLSEDDAVGYTFNQFLYHNAPPEWLLLFPMTKAAIRTMDAAQEIAPKFFGLNIEKFIISGASKRGWTTWLAGAVEADGKKRVKAMIPVVLDLLDMENFLQRQFRSYMGSYSFAMRPYWTNGLTAALGTPQFKNLTQLIDPYTFRHRLTVPKMAVNAVGDEFQLLDDQRHWAHDMPGEMKTIMIKNADHTLITNFGEVLSACSAFAQTVVKNVERPSYNWSIAADGQISVQTSRPPKSVNVVYTTVNSPRRDFRDAIAMKKGEDCKLKVLGGCVRFIWWTSNQDNLVNVSSTSFSTKVPVPPSGHWTGFFIEMVFGSEVAGLEDLTFTTPANVLPLGYPFPACSGGANCTGTLV